MKMNLTGKAVLLLVFCAAAAFPADPPAPVTAVPTRTEMPLQPEILNNDGIVALANAGFSDAFIVQKILLSNRTRFDVTVEGLASLRRNALSESLVLFILEHTARPSVAPPSGPAAPAITPMALTSKFKMKKIVVPVQSIDMMLPSNLVLSSGTTVGMNAAALSSFASFANPVVPPFTPQPGTATADSRAYGYSYPQVAPPLTAASWWR